jgi:peptidoglycan-N-acetylglucosamine deacetylase
VDSCFGPDRSPSAIVLTFDNLGEASELERGSWPADAPPGRHASVTVALPRLLEALEEHRLKATFFVEAINCEMYPDALREVTRRGNELGMHGWRHEQWGSLTAERERELLARGLTAFASIGIEPRGFRPPGGELISGSPARLRACGFEWCSPEGGEFGVRDGLVFVPFEWKLVDAYHLMERFGGSLDPGELAPLLCQELEQPGARTLILHPFLMLDESWFAGVRRLLARIGELAVGRRTWVVPGGEFADWLSR